MIFNTLKQFFYCGIFHETELTMDLAYDIEPTRYGTAYCKKCGTWFEID